MRMNLKLIFDRHVKFSSVALVTSHASKKHRQPIKNGWKWKIPTKATRKYKNNMRKRLNQKWRDCLWPCRNRPIYLRFFRIANKYLCPVFKWGTWDEWYFGFQRVLKFPADRKQNERTYLLKTLAGCPNDPATIQKLLNFTVLTKDEHFKDNDLYLIYNMLTGNPKGYTTLFEFLTNNFDKIKKR